MYFTGGLGSLGGKRTYKPLLPTTAYYYERFYRWEGVIVTTLDCAQSSYFPQTLRASGNEYIMQIQG